MPYQVVITEHASKQLQKVPNYIVLKLTSWVKNVHTLGLETTRTIAGYHDEPLKGDRKGQRSIRLNKSYRAIYEVSNQNKDIQLIRIEEVTNHKY